MDLGDPRERPVLDPRGHRGGHAADQRVRADQVEQALVQRAVDTRVELGVAKGVDEAIFAHGEQELGERHGLEVAEGDAPHGHRKRRIGEREVEQRACGDDVERRQLLGEPPELAEHLRSGLHLVEKEQAPARHEAFSQAGLEEAQRALGVVRAEERGQIGIALEVDVGDSARKPRRELLDQPGFSRLTGTA